LILYQVLLYLVVIYMLAYSVRRLIYQLLAIGVVEIQGEKL